MVAQPGPVTAPGTTIDCVVVGTGPVGLAAAKALATTGADVVLIDTAGSNPLSPEAEDQRPSPDPRTAALFPASLALLRRLGAWDAIAQSCAPLRAIRIVDATGELLRAPELLFSAEEIGWPGFGYNVPQAALSRGLWQALRDGPVAIEPGGPVIALETPSSGSSTRAMLTLADGRRIYTSLVVAADGRNSLCRAAAGIASRGWSYPQTAITCQFAHGRPHHGISTEFHSHAGPCTTVPLPGDRSSLVWVERPDMAEQLRRLPPAEFLHALEARLGGLLGTLSDLGPRRGFALTGLTAKTLGRDRVALVGEAGHVLPPIGAQGLNLGLLDVAVLAEVVGDARRRGEDIGGPRTLQAYAGGRHGDIEKRGRAVDVVNRMLISQLLPLSLVRGFGLHMIAASPALRRRLMREGLQPADPLPALMREAG